MPTEIIVDYDSPGLTGALSVFYFDSTGDLTAQRVSLDQLFTDASEFLANDTSWEVRTSGRIMNDATGVLTGEWVDPTPLAGSGTGGTTELANATSVLLRWATGSIVNGRFVRGRTFVPGLSSAACTGGEVSTSGQVGFAQAALAFATANTGFGVWHRPTSGAGGSFHPATSGSVWNEFGVQRRRR